MKELSIIILCLFFSGHVAAADNLWTKAVEQARQFQDRVPGRMEMISEMLDGYGKVKEREEMWFAITLKADGELDQALVKYLKDGKDITKEKQAELEKEKAREKAKDEKKESVSIGFESAGLFDPDLQKDTQVTETAQRKTVNGKICLGYAFKQKSKNKGEGTLVGKAWFDAATGAPTEVEYTNDPLPKHVKEMTTTIRYTSGPDGAWQAQEMKMEGVGGILFIKKRFRMTMRFEDYFPYPHPPEKK